MKRKSTETTHLEIGETTLAVGHSLKFSGQKQFKTMAIRSNLFEQLDSFLPKIRKSNIELQAKLQCGEIDIDDIRIDKEVEEEKKVDKGDIVVINKEGESEEEEGEEEEAEEEEEKEVKQFIQFEFGMCPIEDIIDDKDEKGKDEEEKYSNYNEEDKDYEINMTENKGSSGLEEKDIIQSLSKSNMMKPKIKTHPKKNVLIQELS